MKRMIPALGFLNFFEHRFEPLFELAAVFGPGDQRAHVQGNELFVLETLGYVAADNPLRQAFDNGRLADPGIADQHRIVLGAPGEHLDHAANLFVAADHRIELALLRQLGEVAAVFAEGFISGFGILRRDPLVAANIFEPARQLFARDTKLFKQPSRRAAIVDHRQQQMLDGNVFVFDLLRFFFGLSEHTVQPCR